MVTQKIIVSNEQGLHMRPATMFSAAVTPFDADVKISFNGNLYDGKSVMMLMAACIKCGDEIEIQCVGTDEKAALEKAIELVESGLGE